MRVLAGPIAFDALHIGAVAGRTVRESLSSTMAEGPTNRLYVGNIPWSTTVDELRGIFSGCAQSLRGHPHRPPAAPRLRHRRVLQRERGSGRHPDLRRCVNSPCTRFQRRRRQSRCLRVDAREGPPAAFDDAVPRPSNCPDDRAGQEGAMRRGVETSLSTQHDADPSIFKPPVTLQVTPSAIATSPSARMALTKSAPPRAAATGPPSVTPPPPTAAAAASATRVGDQRGVPYR